MHVLQPYSYSLFLLAFHDAYHHITPLPSVSSSVFSPRAYTSHGLSEVHVATYGGGVVFSALPTVVSGFLLLSIHHQFKTAAHILRSVFLSQEDPRYVGFR